MDKIGIKRRGIWIALVIAAVMSAAAFTQAPTPTPYVNASAVPRLVIRNGVMTWVNTQAFKPVPSALLKQGESVCRIFDTPTQKYRAAGYHPRALNAEGKPFPGGGYFCVKK